MITDAKYSSLIEYLKNLQKLAVAFSGGLDSSFLLRVSKEALGDNVVAFTIKTPYIPYWEIEEAKEICKLFKIRHIVLNAGIIKSIHNNPGDRCYLCKSYIFSHFKKEAKQLGFNYVCDGTNVDDLEDYRPGLKALKELEILSPLLENKITKKEIRKYSKELGLPNWDKPAYACLLTRVPYNKEIEADELERIEKAEIFLHGLGFYGARVRCHGFLARIEVNKIQFPTLIENNTREKIIEELKCIGFRYITIDLEGYRMGSMNL